MPTQQEGQAIEDQKSNTPYEDLRWFGLEALEDGQIYEIGVSDRLRDPSSWNDDALLNFGVYFSSTDFACYGRSFFSTSNGKVGIGPDRMRQGDRICIFDGCVTPFVIRQKPGSTELYEFLGEAYVDGVMYGEALEMGAARNMIQITLV